jgi:hypothetical protein
LEVNLVMTDRQRIEVDYCPQCRGVWLDRGELDKIIERSAAAPVTPQPQPGADWQQPELQQRIPPQAQPYPRRDYDDDDDDYRHGRKKKGGFLGELFDFD